MTTTQHNYDDTATDFATWECILCGETLVVDNNSEYYDEIGKQWMEEHPSCQTRNRDSQQGHGKVAV